MEAKLAAYREKKAKDKQAEESLLNTFKSIVTSPWKKHQGSENQAKQNNVINKDSADTEDSGVPSSVVKRKYNATELKANQSSETEEREEIDSEAKQENTSVTFIWTMRILKLLLWLCVWGLFIEFQFGAVFFAFSALLFTYFNTRTGPKDSKPSAYSVFNKDCERIQGTLTAEQLQRNMFSVPGLPS